MQACQKGVGGGLEEDGAQCTNCSSGTHNTEFCWGKCVYCEGFGHRASQCSLNKGLPGVGGAVKKAGAEGEGGKLTKADKRRLNKQRKKAEEARNKLK